MAINFPKILSLAKQTSKCSDHHSFHIGCVIYDKKGRVLSVGYNHLHKTHPLLRRYDQHKTLHAECSAILGYRNPEHFKNATILVYREQKNGELANSRPCHMCLNIIKLYKFKKLLYTTENGIQEEVI